MDHSAAPLIDHLIELRQRLIWCVVYLLVGFGICYVFVEDIYTFLAQPFVDVANKNGQDPNMIAIGIHEQFFVYLKIAFFASFCVTFPLISMQVWKFVAPGLYRNEKKAFLPFLIGTPVLFALGASLSYFVVIPLAWNFFMSFQISPDHAAQAAGAAASAMEHPLAKLSVTVMPSVKEYWSLVMMMILAFGFTFELPILLLLLARVGIVTAEGLAKSRKYVVVGAFAFAAIMTPPDFVSQILLGVPILLLYELSIIAIRLTIKEEKNV
ncbi:twin-arginine translocase subunit TatC [Emcibacter nanhaiensis]|uniref:Sec-independent protein translocase protein TatC n=2 Tax=Emcibacter nanhaiensis TaxID=1505037 RepID=A0A501PT76_9PROT|nr:twin-arginine translocase subunit TatC [Emcibacter nanhaiensis]